MTSLLLGGMILAGLCLYAVSAGADFGGGVWDLLATGPRAARQRALIASALAPIWEANHVWLIAVIVLLFTCFPAAFAALSTALHVPLTVMLVGIVLRGSAFTFRSFEAAPAEHRARWSRVFAVSSLVTPFALGVCAGAVAAGRVPLETTAGGYESFVRPWLGAFPLCVGALAVALFAFLAAVYLTVEARERDLREDFRRRALVSGVASGALAWGAFLVARGHAPLLGERLAASVWSAPFHAVTAAAAVAALAALATRRFALARACAAAQVALVVAGWGFSQYPYVLPAQLTLADAAAGQSVLRPVLAAAGVSAAIVAPAFVWLYWLFKRR